MVRAPYFDENGTKKGAWSLEEDQRLIAYIERYGHPNWRQLPKISGLARCGKSCRLRWMNYLRPNLKRGNYTQKEEQMIMELHKKHGNKWSLIAESLPGRSDNEIKNYWHSHLKKISRRNETNLIKEFQKTKTTSEDVSDDSHHIKETQKTKTSETEDVSDDSHHILESSTSMSSSHVELNMNLYRKEDSVASWEIWDGFSNNFWSEPFISENALGQDYSPVSWYGSEAEDPFFIW